MNSPPTEPTSSIVKPGSNSPRVEACALPRFGSGSETLEVSHSGYSAFQKYELKGKDYESRL